MDAPHLSTATFLQVLNQAMLEILGRGESHAILKRSGMCAGASEADLSGVGFSSMLESLGNEMARCFDDATARGLLIRAGRAALIFLRRHQEPISTLGSIDNRLKPVSRRFADSLQELAAALSSPQDLSLEVELCAPMEFEWRMCYLLPTEKPERFTPFFFFGVLQEFCEWLDARKDYQLIYNTAEEQANCDCIHIAIREAQ